MRKLLTLVAVLSLGGCAQTSNFMDQMSQVYDGVANATNSFMTSTGAKGYQEIVYERVFRCSDWKEDKTELCSGGNLSNAEIRLCRDLAVRDMTAKWDFDRKCLSDDEYKKLKDSGKCRFDYFGDLECQRVVNDAETAAYIREQNKKEFKIAWSYKEKHPSWGWMNTTSHATYDVDKYASAVEKLLKNNKKCKFKSKKEIECNMRPPKEFEI